MRRQRSLGLRLHCQMRSLACALLALAVLLPPPAVGAVAVSEVHDRTTWDRSYAEQNGIEYYKTCEAGSSTPTGGSSPGGGTPTGAGTPVTGGGACGEQGYAPGGPTSEANKKQIWNFLKGKGLSDEAAAGIMGNMDKETGGTFMPDAENSIQCKGVVQWCYGRMEDMVAKAPDGKWQCLDYQLNYMWWEMTETSESRVMEPLKNASTPGEAANIFHDYYERSNTETGEHLDRDKRAELIYNQFTGKEVAPTPDSPAGGSAQMANNSTNCTAPNAAKDGDQASGDTTPGSGPIPSADCNQLTSTIRDQVNSGAVVLTNGEDNLDQDLANCTTGPIECNGGVSPEILRALSSTAANSGGGPVKIWSFNTGHGCDDGDHPNGRAVDIVCQGNGAAGHTEECDKQYRYLYDNAAELGINDLIWTNPPPGYQCMDNGKPVSCDVFAGAGDHSDHIHVSTKSNAQAA